MAKRKEEFEIGSYYHVFNRGVDKRNIFQDEEDLKYFLDRLYDFNSIYPLGGVYQQSLIKNEQYRSKASILVSIVAYCLLPNHFHLILKETSDGGISKFMQRVGTGYSKYFNKKYDRSGSLFQGKFKSTHLDKEFSLELTSAYVNLNYRHHQIDPKKDLVKSSIGEYEFKVPDKKMICDKNEIENQIKNFGGIKNLKNYLLDKSNYFQHKKILEYNEKR